MWPNPVSMSDTPLNVGDEVPLHLPGWAVIVFFADALVFFPVIMYIGYTLSHVYPTLAIIEDPQPPAYTALSFRGDGPDADFASPAKGDSPALTTTSFRRIDRLLRAVGGWTANFRGLACALALNCAAAATGAAVSWAVPRQLGVLAALLATVQLSTAWTHIIITVPSALPFWRRLPPFARTFRATWLPVTAYWAASQAAAGLPRLLARALGLAAHWDPARPGAPVAVAAPAPGARAPLLWQGLAVGAAAAAAVALLVIPAEAVLVRVQASLLPADADMLVPFDRSFGGAVEPEVVTGRGYVGFRTAWRTFARASWLRLYRLLAEILAVAAAAYVLFLLVVAPEFWLMLKASEPAGSS